MTDIDVRTVQAAGGATVRRLVDQAEWRSTCGMRRDLLAGIEGAPVRFHYLRIMDSRKHRHRHSIEYYFVVIEGKRIVAKSPKIYNARNDSHCDAPFARHAIMLTLECLPPGTNPTSMSAGYAAKTIIGNPPPFSPEKPEQAARIRTAGQQ